MYYHDVEKMDFRVAMGYEWQEVDGKPRYRWYKYALNSVHMILDCDKKFDIDHADFSDLKVWYDSAEWVANNDEEALKYIYTELVPPVTQIVKDKYIECLTSLGYYKSCAMAMKYIKSYPVPKERTLERKKKKAIENIEKRLVLSLKSMDQMLVKFKAEIPEKLNSPNDELRHSFSVLLNLEAKFYGEASDKSLAYMEWMRLNAPDSLEKIFSIELSLEIKNQLLQMLTENELYRLHELLDKTIKVKAASFYYEIPAYERNPRDILGEFFDTDDD